MADRPQAPPVLSKAQKWAVIVAGLFFAGLAGLGGYGSFAAVEKVAREYGFGDHAWIVPIGVDLGILALLVADLLLEQLDMALPPLRWLAWTFTAATVWFNIAAVDTNLPWNERLTGQGMHAAMPLLFIAFMEGARHAVRRRTGMVSQRRMDGIRLSRWALDPAGTFGIWRRMILWEVRSYRTGLVLEGHRRKLKGDLRAEYGRRWRRVAPHEKQWPLRGGMLDLALTLTGDQQGAIEPSGGNHPALAAPTAGTALAITGTMVPPAAELAPGQAPAPVPPAPAPMGTAVPPNALTSTGTGPLPAPAAAADSRTPGTTGTPAPNEGTASGNHPATPGTTTGDQPFTPGTTTGDHEPDAGDHGTAPGTTTATTAPNSGPRAHGFTTAAPTFGDHAAQSDTDWGTTRYREHHASPARPDIDDMKLAEARDLARGIIRAGSSKVSRRSLKAAGLTGKTRTLQDIADILNEEIAEGLLVLDESA
ncbi:DUF2637 domain-containing protein [Streptomyces sp. 35G-GA-8]|uniref:DUF2637 domain-containing protein n=1 Tax=Streptomyces sp. 35G-GA-8 TaxID=2939434 RepID=UPI00201F7B68|nr:DUF2637 domain-containing protein [Streptomyces sp. 35G-GA-8]MCL7382196.1 DUF2637 domain-containing protein [Streptomyces sp. 35G-GA-8]